MNNGSKLQRKKKHKGNNNQKKAADSDAAIAEEAPAEAGDHEWVERIGKTAYEICNDLSSNRIELNEQHTGFIRTE